VYDIGIIPERLKRPTVGLMPTMPLLFDGQTIDPLVSVPIAIMQRFAETATAEPELDPHGFLFKIKGFFVCPPIPLHPLEDNSPRKFAHSLKFAFAMIIAPAIHNDLHISRPEAGALLKQPDLFPIGKRSVVFKTHK